MGVPIGVPTGVKDRLKKILVKAPSNIALIKYMGKRDSGANIPENPSLSLTLDGLCSWIELEEAGNGGASFSWVEEPPSVPATGKIPALSRAGIDKFHRHADRVALAAPGILRNYGIAAHEIHCRFIVRTSNTFPPAAGIASSASSFAGLTLAVAAAVADDPFEFERKFDSTSALKRELASLSRQGSGSSCRSFEGPWVHWEEDRVCAVDRVELPRLAHFVLLISRAEKKVSSSEAHSRVKTSPLWDGRIARAEHRTRALLSALRSGDLRTVALIAWTEAWEMHSLFHTSAEPFSYWQPGTIDALHWLAPYLKDRLPPIVTLDAGPNIHVMVPEKQASHWRGLLSEKFGAAHFLEDRAGTGARIVRID